MKEVVIVSACRTPIGAFAGSLSAMPATDLGAIVITEAVKRAGISKEDVDEVIMGNVLPAGLGQNPARQACLKAALPYSVGAVTVNKVCGSGLKAVMLAAQAIICGDADVVVAGGLENMNLAPYYLFQARTGYRMGSSQMIDGMIHDGLWDHLNDFHMGMSAELCAEKYGVTREDMDTFSLKSYEKAIKAAADGKFKDEIVPVPVPQKKGEAKLYEADETLRPTSMEALAKLKPAFKKDGLVTAGNASKIADGAAAVVIMSLDKATSLGIKPMVRVGAQGAAGLDPKYVLVAPMLSIPKVLKKAGLTLADIDLHEINEAFAASSVAINRELGIEESKVNIDGGSIPLGHPIGASGCRVLVTLIHALKRYDLNRGMASLCLGGGEAVSMIVENMK
ncbi:MAG: acetyl-CoA C-acetyltransferase [Deltaproteobacteria bacterium]|nr:acetyl-CoA C-acetyltransferase [Deltaproteobacteria bacterium]